MTRTPTDAERPSLPRPVPIPPPREKWNEEEQAIIDEYDSREISERSLDFDPYA